RWRIVLAGMRPSSKNNCKVLLVSYPLPLVAFSVTQQRTAWMETSYVWAVWVCRDSVSIFALKCGAPWSLATISKGLYGSFLQRTWIGSAIVEQHTHARHTSCFYRALSWKQLRERNWRDL